jgi:DNA-binding response OmpR family regulator
MTAGSGFTPNHPYPRVTLVEDDRQQLAGLFQALRAHGFHPKTVQPDDEPQTWLDQSDLVLMDIRTATRRRFWY